MKFLLSGLACLATSLGFCQTIQPITPGSATRSGRMFIQGTALGASGGQVLVNGIAAPVARWTDTSVVAYVPEETVLGSASVQVIRSDSSPSNVVPVTVTSRPVSDGKVRWTFLTASLRVQVPPVQGTNRTVYIYGLEGNVYALTEDGAIKWITDTSSYGNGDISVHPDGRIVCGGDGRLICLSPDGAILWSKNISGDSVAAGPTIGPDGLIYAQFDNVRGACIFDMNGNQLWNDPQARSPGGGGSYTQKISFGAGNWSFVVQDGRNNDTETWSYHLGGGLAWHVDLGLSGTRTSSNGDVVAPAVINRNTLAAFQPNGSLRWSVPFTTLGAATYTPAVTADGHVYTTNQAGRLYAISPTGQVRWSDQLMGFNVAPCETGVRTDGTRILAHAGGGLAQNGVVSLYTATGQKLWTIQLPKIDGVYPVTFTSPISFALDQQTAFAGCSHDEYNVDKRSFVYALETNTTPRVRIGGRIEFTEHAGQPPTSAQIEYLDASHQLIHVESVTLDTNGVFSALPPLTPGTYYVSVHSRSWLRRTVGPVDTHTSQAGLVLSLVNGDIDHDNEIGIGDYSQLSSAFGQSSGDPLWNEDADLNGDGSVDIADYAILSGHYGEVGD